ncbi:response regulator [bacterium]|nr:response regulator [bacterium]
MFDTPNKIKKILIAEDDVNIRLLTQQMLEAFDYETIAVENGLAAWNLLEKEEFDLVLTDIMMPMLSGTDLVKRIRESKNYLLPIIVVSGSHVDLFDTMEVGNTKTLAKPFQLETLIRLIQSFETHIVIPA